MATAHSQICCEKLVAAGAINTLLKLIRSVSRSIPDQEVLKHALSTLRNLSRYPHLAEVLIDTRGSVETILWEFLRCAHHLDHDSKNSMFFISFLNIFINLLFQEQGRGIFPCFWASEEDMFKSERCWSFKKLACSFEEATQPHWGS